MNLPRRFVVVILLAGWLGPLTLTARPDDSCCCPEGKHGACMRTNASGSSLKRCAARDIAFLVAPRILVRTVPALPEPVEIGSVVLLPVIRPGAADPDPFDPPPRA
ncbi:MAG TPA: hypothetical protein VKS03_11020 [Thermoanaerobaculia bacterium]|nr:hypothetical protein [Thermoanaerobaculia bacterium]